MFHAADEELFQTLLDMDLPVFFYESKLSKEYREKTGTEYVLLCSCVTLRSSDPLLSLARAPTFMEVFHIKD